MIVREAYRDERHSVCRDHYNDPPPGAPTFGPVEDARDSAPCEWCDEAPVTDEERFQRFSTRTAYALVLWMLKDTDSDQMPDSSQGTRPNDEGQDHAPTCLCEACDAMGAVRLVDRLRSELAKRDERIASAEAALSSYGAHSLGIAVECRCAYHKYHRRWAEEEEEEADSMIEKPFVLDGQTIFTLRIDPLSALGRCLLNHARREVYGRRAEEANARFVERQGDLWIQVSDSFLDGTAWINWNTVADTIIAMAGVTR